MTSLYRNIFLADDDQDDRDIFVEIMQMLDPAIRVSVATDGADALHYLNTDVTVMPELLFIDINMPKVGGTELLREIKKSPKLQNIPVVMYSTSLNEQQKADLMKLGASYTSPRECSGA